MWAKPDEGNVLKSSSDLSWKKLLHYQKKWVGSEQSLITAPEFFLSSDGRTNPENELSANLQAFNEDAGYACRFPARAVWISQRLQMPVKKCADTEDWKMKIQAETVAIVHVSQFVSNPSSAFGHSFLLFQNASRPLNMHMAVNNAADVPEDVGAWDYITKGLFGGFPGGYSLEPFYIKIQEYNHIENRDMWIYQLNLNSAEIDQLLNHIWELTENGTEAYYFLNRNCSVNIYNAIAAIRPGLDFFSDNHLYVVPVESIQRVKDLVVKITYLPSMREKIIQKQEHLKKSKNPDIEQAEIQLDLFEFKKSQNEGKLSAQQAKSYSEQLIKRSKLGPNQDVLVVQSPEMPDGATKTWRIAAGIKRLSNKNYGHYSLAPLYRSIVQKTDGYLPNSEVVALKMDFLQDQENRFTIDNMIFVKLVNLPTSSDFDSQSAFRAQIGMERKTDCKKCHFFSAELAMGKSLSMGGKNVVYGMLGLLQGPKQVLLPEFILGGTLHFSEIIFNLEHQYLQDISKHGFSEKRWKLQAGWSYAAHRDLQLVSQRVGDDSYYTALWGFYF